MTMRTTLVIIIGFLLASGCSTESVGFPTCFGVKSITNQDNKIYVKQGQDELDKAEQELNKKFDFQSYNLMNLFLRVFNVERRSGLTTWVEVGPGAYKSEIVDYPKNLLVAELKKLLSLKAEIDKRDQDLNRND